MMRKINRLKGLYEAKTLVLMIMFIGFMSVSVSAFNFDNTKKYDANTKQVTITNLFGMGNDLAKVTLEENTYYCIKNCYAVIRFDLLKDSDNPFNDLKFYRGKTSMLANLKSSGIYLRDGNYSIDVGEYSQSCQEKGNGTICETIRSPKFETFYTYGTKYNNENLKAGTYYFKIIGIKEPAETIEWIPDFLGMSINEWATWQTSYNLNLTAYYNLDTGSGVQIINTSGIWNGTLFPSSSAGRWTAGILGNAVTFNGSNFINITANSGDEFDKAFGGNTAMNHTYTFWVNFKSLQSGGWDYIFAKTTAGTFPYLKVGLQNRTAATGGNMSMWIGMKETGLSELRNALKSNVTFELNKWYFIVWRYKGQECVEQDFFINGKNSLTDTICDAHSLTTNAMTLSTSINIGGNLEDAGTLSGINGTIDEIGIWNRSLSDTEIFDMWNNGLGMTYLPNPDFYTTLNYPSNNFISGLHQVVFNCSAFNNLGLVSNMSLIINNQIKQFINGDGTGFRELYSIQTLGGGSYNWTCNATSNANVLVTASQRSLNVTNYAENSQTFNVNTTEGNTETFKINITYDSSYYPNSIAYLMYNNTQFSSTGLTIGNDTIFTSVMNVPFVNADITKSFYWSLGFINSTGTNYFNSSVNNQTISNLGIDDCAVFTNTILNYTLKDEQTQLLINATDLNSTIELNVLIYSYIGNNLALNYSKSFNNTNTARVCLQAGLLNNSQYSLYSQAKYYALTYATRYNYIQNFTLTNSTMKQQITLFDLLSTYATPFIMTYTGNTFLATPGVVISINRQYLSENTYKTVESELTDNTGKVIGYFDVTAKYQIIVTQNGQVLAVFSSVTPYCANAALGCTIALNANSQLSQVIDFNTYNNLMFADSFNQTTGIYNLIFSTLDNSVSNITIILTKNNNLGTFLCSNSVITSSGSLTCVIPTTQNVTFISTIYKDGVGIAQSSYAVEIIGAAVFTGNWVIFIFGIILIFGVMLIPSAIGVVVGSIIGVVIAGYLFFVNGAYITGGFFIFLVIAGILIILRIRSGGSE